MKTNAPDFPLWHLAVASYLFLLFGITFISDWGIRLLIAVPGYVLLLTALAACRIIRGQQSPDAMPVEYPITPEAER